MSYSYVEVICEAKLNVTETAERIKGLLEKFILGEAILDTRQEGKFLMIRNNSENALQLFGDWIRQAQILDTVRSRLFGSIVGNVTALYFNRQAAAMDKLSLLDADDNPPLGPIILNIVSDDLPAVIDELAPKTHKGKILTKEEWERVERKRQRQKK